MRLARAFNRTAAGMKQFRTIFIFFAFLILAISCTFFALSFNKPYMGIRISINGSWTVEHVDRNGLANQAEIQQGEKPIEINGQPAEIFLEKYKKSTLVTGRVVRDLTVVDNHGRLKSVTLNGNSPSREAVFEVTTWFILCLVFWITGFYVFFKRPKKAAAWLLCLCGLSLGLALSGNIAGERAIPTATFLEVAGTVVFPWLLLHFFLTLPEERAWLINRPIVYLLYLPAVVTVVLFPLIGYDTGPSVQWFRTVRIIEYGAGFLGVVCVAIFNYFRAVSFRTRQQMKIVLFSTIAALIPFTVLNIVPEAIWRQTILPAEVSVLTYAFVPLGLGYAVVTKKLMDIDVIIRRSVIYGLITLIMATILSTAIFLAVQAPESVSIPEEIALALILGAIATVLFGPIKKGVENLVDRLFYKDRYDYRKIIQSLSTSLKLLKNLTDISRLIVGTTVNTLNLAGGCLFIKAQSGAFEINTNQGVFTVSSKQKKLLDVISQRSSVIEFPNSASAVCSDLAFFIPLIAGEREVGILCLSPKVTRQDFSSDDVFLLQGIASVAAITLHSAMLIRDVSIRDTFVSVASHELRTPLTSIVGYADLLLRRDPPDITRKRWLKNIFYNSQRVSAMVDDLLNVSRIHSGKVSIKLERVSLPDVVTESLTLAKESTNKHEFVINIEPNLPDVMVDSEKFIQILGNLLNNAIKYSPNGGRISVLARNESKQHRIVISITDEGIGIGEADKDSLFTTFHRIQRPETKGVRGSGLGLYIAKEWTEAMGGKIWLESELDKGSTFFIAIPVQNSKRTE